MPMYIEKKEAIVYFSIIFVINLFGNNCVCECEISPSLQIIIIKKKETNAVFCSRIRALGKDIHIGVGQECVYNSIPDGCGCKFGRKKGKKFGWSGDITPEAKTHTHIQYMDVSVQYPGGMIRDC